MDSSAASSAPEPRPAAPSDRQVLDRLGPGGLEQVLADLLDQPRLVKLANACKLSYPGMRVQSQKREKILRDLAGKASIDEVVATKVLRAVRKEASAAAKVWSTLDAEGRLRRLRGDGAAPEGEILLVAADGALERDLEEALRDAVGGLRPAAPASPTRIASGSVEERRELARLRKKVTEIQKKVRHLEGQLAKFRESEKTLKRDLIQRKGELAESRMLAERLGRELQESKGTATAPPPKGDASETLLSGVDRALKKLASEQRRLSHRLEKMDAAAPPPGPATLEAGLSTLRESVAAVEKEFAALRRERKRDLTEQAKRLDEIQAAAVAARSAAEQGASPGRFPPRRRGEPERVGVFIDVQNVWYGARQLKGKLDFDALLQAAVLDRRLIQATAYVVESKEIDQSGFIARLDQRGIDVKRKTLRVRADGSTKGDWDMEMALDMLDAAPRLHVVVLVSGDGDFTSLARRIKAIGPKVEVISFPRNTAKSLIEASDKFQPLDRKYMIRDPAPPPSPATPRAKPDEKDEPQD